jgi:5-methylcytosine-specific restriction endonuclease McrA
MGRKPILICPKCGGDRVERRQGKKRVWKCLPCHAKRQREYIEKHPEKAGGGKEYYQKHKDKWRGYYQARREEILERAAKRREANREYLREERRRWYRENKEKVREYNKSYKEENSERLVELRRLHYENNPDRYRELSRRYRQNNPEKMREIRAARRARMAAAEGRFTAEEWLALCEKYDNRCLCCGAQEKLSVDHVIPLSRGGTNYIDNLQPLCSPCNSSKGTKIIDYRT